MLEWMFDVCEAYYLLEAHYNISGVLQERNKPWSVGWQLHRIGFRPGPMLTYDTLSDQGKEIYDSFVARHKLPIGG